MVEIALFFPQVILPAHQEVVFHLQYHLINLVSGPCTARIAMKTVLTRLLTVGNRKEGMSASSSSLPDCPSSQKP